MENQLIQIRDQLAQTRQYIHEAQQAGNTAALRRWMAVFREQTRQAQAAIQIAVRGIN